MSAAGSSRRAWGWHRLDDGWARRIVAEADVRPGRLVLDIGAGDGALTRPLLAAGARVIAIEQHAGRAVQLRELAAAEPALTVAVRDARLLHLPSRPFVVVSNLPYAGSSEIVARLLSRGSQLLAADVVVQRGLALRLIAGRAPGAARWQREFVLETGIVIPRRAFRPPPKVDSVVLRVRRKATVRPSRPRATRRTSSA